MTTWKLESGFYSKDGNCFVEEFALTENEKKNAGKHHDGWLVKDTRDDCYGWADNNGSTWATEAEAIAAYRENLDDSEDLLKFDAWAEEQQA